MMDRGTDIRADIPIDRHAHDNNSNSRSVDHFACVSKSIENRFLWFINQNGFSLLNF